MNATGTTAITPNTGASSAASKLSASASSTAAQQVDPKLQKVAQQFESIFLRQMIGAMRSSSLAEGMLDSNATQQFRDMADARTADEMAKTSRFGIADLLMKQLAPKASLNSVSPANAAAKMQDVASADAQIAHVGTATAQGGNGL